MAPLRKHNQVPSYINTGFNHPEQVFNYIPNGIMVKFSTYSSIRNNFTQNKHEYGLPLKNSRYKPKLVYKSRDEVVDQRNRNNRAGKILWFTPPYNMTVANKIGKEIFRLLKKNFPLSNSSYKIFKKNAVE